ncbi:peroxin [Datura stramonium]|uniref:Peroxin n=1 Tax=Datura stramonium TaxID=4076 RepID=A0ABS8VPH7_DATST|nr:peroxin [Datura stramonium]
MWKFWRRHKRKVYVALGVLGSGYFLYKLYDTHRRKLSDLRRELFHEQRSEELIKFQVKAHFEDVQKIADSTTLPHAMWCLRSQIEEELDLTHLTERLMKGKDLPNSLTAAEKLELWDRLKVLSFTRMVLSLWATTLLNLYIRVQVNILGRHLYIDTARGIGGSGQFVRTVTPFLVYDFIMGSLQFMMITVSKLFIREALSLIDLKVMKF